MFSRPPENGDPLRELREKLRQGSRDSFRLLENFWDNPIYRIMHDEANRCIMVVWETVRDPDRVPLYPREDALAHLRAPRVIWQDKWHRAVGDMWHIG
jgi:hypothetical protein